jgi:hypothetical protein
MCVCTFGLHDITLQKKFSEIFFEDREREKTLIINMLQFETETFLILYLQNFKNTLDYTKI